MSIFARATLPLGLHVNADGFALCEVAHASRGTILRRVVCERLSDRALVPEALAAAVKTHGWQRRSCVVGIAAEAAMLHPLHLPPMPRRERIAAARLEAERLAPERGEPLAVDVSALHNGWMLATCPRSAVRALVSTATSASLRPRAVDLETLALARAVGAGAGDAVLDVGEHRGVLILLTDGVPFTRVLAVGASVDALAGRLAETLEFARSRGFGVAQRIMLAGDLALRDGIAQRLAEAVRAPVTLAEPRADLSTQEHPIDFVRATAPRWLVACGLALWALRGRPTCA